VAITAWADTHPYEVRTTHYRNRDAYHLRFAPGVPPEIAAIAADAAYNLRSGLDHLMGALVPSTQRDSVYFPIYFQGVWEDASPGENEERTKARGRWKSDTSKLRSEVVAILKGLQPTENRGQQPRLINTFKGLNLIANKDGHQELPLVFSGLQGLRVIWTDAQGNHHIGPADTGDPSIDQKVAEDGAELILPKRAVDVHVAGAPVVAIAISPQEGAIQIPDFFDLALGAYRDRAVGPLAPYVRR
jgi:hypothetical protein